MNYILLSIIAYITMLIAVSIWHKKKNYHKNEDYLIADRSLSALTTGLTMIASLIGGGTLLGLTALLFKFGPQGAIYLTGAFFSIIILSFWAGEINKEARKEKWLTLYDYFHHRYGSFVKYIVGILQLTTTVVICSIALIGGAKLIHLLAGFSDVTSILLMAGVVCIYLMISGFGAVVKTDVIQAAFILLLFILIYVFAKDSLNINTISKYREYTDMGIASMVSFFLLGMTLILGEENTIQRIYAAKSAKVAKKSLLVTAGLYVFVYGSLTFLSILLSKTFPDLSGDSAFIESILRITPNWAMSIVSIGIFSILLSTIDTFVFSGAMNINKLILDRGSQYDHIKLKKRIQSTVPLILLTMVAIALSCKSIVSYTLIYSEIIAVTSIVFAISFVFKKLNKWYAIFPLILNIIFLSLFLIFVGSSVQLIIIPFIIVPIGCLMAFIFNFICKKVNNG